MQLFSFPQDHGLADKIAKHCNFKRGTFNWRRFPDGESYLKFDQATLEETIGLVCTLTQPDEKAMALMFFSQTAREFGAKNIRLIAPYLSYMRQDKRFESGEAVTSKIFAKFLSTHVDELITIDPHLHRYDALSEIYDIPSHSLHAGNAIADWIKANIDSPLLIGPDSESEQWVSAVAARIGAPFEVLEKVRKGDKDVEISVPDIHRYLDHTPILVDDIISTARTMMGTVTHLLKTPLAPPVCIGIHALFAEDAYDALKQSGAGKIVTCNTIEHSSNAIDISPLLAQALS